MGFVAAAKKGSGVERGQTGGLKGERVGEARAPGSATPLTGNFERGGVFVSDEQRIAIKGESERGRRPSV